jgi:hypothetical protein
MTRLPEVEGRYVLRRDYRRETTLSLAFVHIFFSKRDLTLHSMSVDTSKQRTIVTEETYQMSSSMPYLISSSSIDYISEARSGTKDDGKRTLDFVFADVDERRWLNHVAGEVENHLEV